IDERRRDARDRSTAHGLAERRRADPRIDDRVDRELEALVGPVVVADLLALRLAVLVVRVPGPLRVADKAAEAEDRTGAVAIGVHDLLRLLREVLAQRRLRRERIEAREEAAVAGRGLDRRLKRGVADEVRVLRRIDADVDRVVVEAQRTFLNVD